MDTIPADQITVVTAIFDLTIRDPNRSRSIDDYMKLGNTLLNMPINLFIVAEPHLSPIIWKQRAKMGLLDRTFIYTLRLEDSPLYRYHYDIERCHKHGDIPGEMSPTKDTPYYTIVGWTRYWIIQQSIKLNPFNSIGRMWIDYGLFHLYSGREIVMGDRFIQCLSGIPVDKIKLLVMRDTAEVEIADRRAYFSVRQTKVAGGICCGPDKLLDWMSSEVMVEIEHCMSYRYPALDETVLNMVYTLNPDKFAPYYGFYPDIVPNFLGCVDNLRTVIMNLNHCLHHGMVDKAKRISQYILDGLDNKTIAVDSAMEGRLRAIANT